jgi:hypothetical protein
MKIISTIKPTIFIFKDPSPPRWIPVGYLTSGFWLLIALFSTADPKHLDHLEQVYFNNPHANNSGFLHSREMTLIASGVSLISCASSLFMTARSVKELKKVGDSFKLINWRSKEMSFTSLSRSNRGWPSRIPMGLRSWDSVIEGNGKKYFLNTRGIKLTL